MATQVQVLYLAVGNQYRRRKVRQTANNPIALDNQRDRQLHLLRGDPIFDKVSPVLLESIDGLASMDAPLPTALPESRMMICEEDNVWPVSRVETVLPVDEQLNQLEDLYQEGFQRAESKAAEDSTGSRLDKMMLISGFVAVALVAIMGLIVLNHMYGGGGEEVTGMRGTLPLL